MRNREFKTSAFRRVRCLHFVGLGQPSSITSRASIHLIRFDLKPLQKSAATQCLSGQAERCYEPNTNQPLEATRAQTSARTGTRNTQHTKTYERHTHTNTHKHTHRHKRHNTTRTQARAHNPRQVTINVTVAQAHLKMKMASTEIFVKLNIGRMSS